MSLESRIRSAAAANPALAALLTAGSPAVFRWYDTTLQPGSTLPAVVAQVISNPANYAVNTRLGTSFARIQLTVWGGQSSAGAAAVDSVAGALFSFFDGLNMTAISRTGQQNNFVVGNRKAVYFQEDTPIHQRVIDVQIFGDESAG